MPVVDSVSAWWTRNPQDHCALVDWRDLCRCYEGAAVAQSPGAEFSRDFPTSWPEKAVLGV
jgi:hypothetical protein